MSFAALTILCFVMRILRRLLPIFAALFLSLAARAADSQFWQRQNIYQVITDRFYDGDKSNNNADGNYAPAGRTSVHGGDFKGLEQKLDYIQALGATAIWISPIVLNARGEFHGYAALDFNKVDPHWGTLADLQRLIQSAHARGMLVIDDIVVNHGGNLVDSADPSYPHFKYPPDGYQLRLRRADRGYPPPFDLNATNPALTNLFHNQGLIQNYDDPTQAQLGELSGLDDFRTENPYVRAQMEKIYQDWIARAGFDGFRVDTVKHVEMSFWQEWCPAIHTFAAAHGKPNFFMFGEVMSGSDALCASYIGTNGGGPFKLDSTLDYPLYFKSEDIFARATAPTAQLAGIASSITASYEPSAQTRLVTFLDNHDQPRFLSRNQADNDLARLKVALVFLYTSPGVPSLYYGTEQAFNGETDPFDREDMFAGQFKDGPRGVDSFDMTHPLFQWIARLNNFRRLYPALVTGSYNILYSDKFGPGLFAYTRRAGDQEIFVTFNTARTSQTVPACATTCADHTKLINLLDSSETIITDSSKTPPIEVPAESAKIFLAQSQIRALDPVVIKISPAHDARNISTNSPIDVQFSQPMDTGSVESAFTTTPAIQGVFSWSSARDTFTFKPNSPSLPSDAAIFIHLASTARATSGPALHASFDSQFKTR